MTTKLQLSTKSRYFFKFAGLARSPFVLTEHMTSLFIAERAKRARHYQGCPNSWCGIYIFIPRYVTFNVRDWSKSVELIET